MSTIKEQLLLAISESWPTNRLVELVFLFLRNLLEQDAQPHILLLLISGQVAIVATMQRSQRIGVLML